MRTSVVGAYVAAVLAASCAPPGMTRHDVSQLVRQRTGTPLRPQSSSTAFTRPPGVTERDGLSEQDAVALALWNNGALQADLAQLDVSRADLAEAALLPNPLLSLVFPLGPRQLAAYLSFPIELLWQRPRRMAAAEQDLARVAHGLVQNGLDVARDVRLAYLDTQLALERERLLREGAGLLVRLRDIARVRVSAGDVAATDAEAIEADAAAFEARAAQARFDREAARARLGRLTGLGAAVPDELPAMPERADALPPEATLMEQALAARPDLRAAELGIEAASARLGWERSRAWAFIAVLDAGTSAGQGFGASPGFRAELPLFSRNQGGIGRAEAELQRASWRYVAVRQQLRAELATALAAHAQAAATARLASAREIPASERLVALARSNYAAGDLPWFAVLDAQRTLVDARLRALDASAVAQRAYVEVERCVGGPIHARR